MRYTTDKRRGEGVCEPSAIGFVNYSGSGSARCGRLSCFGLIVVYGFKGPIGQRLFFHCIKDNWSVVEWWVLFNPFLYVNLTPNTKVKVCCVVGEWASCAPNACLEKVI